MRWEDIAAVNRIARRCMSVQMQHGPLPMLSMDGHAHATLVRALLERKGDVNMNSPESFNAYHPSGLSNGASMRSIGYRCIILYSQPAIRDFINEQLRAHEAAAAAVCKSEAYDWSESEIPPDPRRCRSVEDERTAEEIFESRHDTEDAALFEAQYPALADALKELRLRTASLEALDAKAKALKRERKQARLALHEVQERVLLLRYDAEPDVQAPPPTEHELDLPALVALS